MLTEKQLLNWTRIHRNSIPKKATKVKVNFTDCDYDDEGGVYVQAVARSQETGIPHECEIHYYNRNKVWVTCTCEYFKYHCEVANHRRGSSDILESNGKLPRITNRRMVSHVCKHLYACFIRGASKLKPEKFGNKKPEEE